MAAVDEAVRARGRVRRPGARVAIRAAGSYGYLGAGEFEGCERLLDEALELAGDDHRAAAGS